MGMFDVDNIAKITMMEKKDSVRPLFDVAGKVEEELQKRAAGNVVKLDITSLIPSTLNQFRPIPDDSEKWQDLIESVKAKGVLTPIQVRVSKEEAGKYEILAGHNRVRAAKQIGIEQVPAIILDVDDEEAVQIIGISNIYRDEITDREWGQTYKKLYDILRNNRDNNKSGHDVHQTIKARGHDDHRLVETGGHDVHQQKISNEEKVDTMSTNKKIHEIVAEKFGVNERTVRRKMRLTFIEPDIYNYLYSINIPNNVLIELSYLTKTMQTIFANMPKKVIQKVTVDEMRELRKLSETGTLDKDMMDEILINRKQEKKKKEEKGMVSKYSISNDLIPTNLKRKEKQEYVIKALMYIKQNEIKL